MSNDYSNINNYEFKKTIGEGNFAKVKLSIFKSTNEEFAIKIINKNKIKEKMKNTIFRENEIISKLNHPNIIKVFKIIEDSENFYIIMENCKNGELFDYIVKNRYLSENEASIFFYQLINGVEYIHSQNIVHRDLKPENLLLTENKALKIIDFGLSHPFDGSELLKTKCGSPSYAAPEIISFPEYDGFKTDIWCCGVILYAMVCGFLPFDGEDERELFKNIEECDPEIPIVLSKETKYIIRKIFTPNPKKRITIQEIKLTDFYLRGKELFNLKYEITDSGDIINDKKYNFILNFYKNLIDGKKENGNDNINKKNNNNEIQVSINEEKDNNFEAITISDDDCSLKNNNVNIFDINKLIKLKEIKAINSNTNNSNNNNIHVNINDNNENEDKKNYIHLQTNVNVEESKIKKMKLQLNFNNNLKNNYNNHLFNSFRKKLLKEELNSKQKKQYENQQKIIETEMNELKNDTFKNKINNQKYEQKIINSFNNTNYTSINSENKIKGNNQISQNQLAYMRNIRDHIMLNKRNKENIFLKTSDSHNIKNILTKNKLKKTKKLILGKTPDILKYYLNNNSNIQFNSFKIFYNNLINKKISFNNSKKNKTIDKSINIRNINDEKISNNTLNVNIIGLNNIKSNSIESKNISSNTINYKDNHSITLKNQNNIYSWKKTNQKINNKGKISPYINSLKKNIIKNNLNKIKLVSNTPKRESNLYYNNINININTININDNRNNKFIDNNKNNKKINSEKRKIINYEKANSKNKDFINFTETNSIYKDDKSSFDKISNNIKINFSKIIEKSKKKRAIYFYNKNKRRDIIAVSVDSHHKIINGDNFKNGNMKRNLGNNSLFKYIVIGKRNPKSEKKIKMNKY